MARKIAIILGHPDPGPTFCRALAQAYAQGAREAGSEVRQIDVASLDIEFLRRAEDFRTGSPSAAIREAQDIIAWADHLVIIYPLWHGTMPALLKAFFEQCFRPGYALDYGTGTRWPKQLLGGRSARAFSDQIEPFDRDDFTPRLGACRTAMLCIGEDMQRRLGAKAPGLR